MSTAASGDEAARRRLLVLLPLAVFLALAALFFFRLGSGDPSRIPSALIGRPAPDTNLPPVRRPRRARRHADARASQPADFKGAVTLVNVWASWCVPCHDEAPLLDALAEDKRIRIVGINYKDQPDNARRFLGRYGNPFVAAGADGNGRASIDWGVYGVPETFIVGRDGRIAYKLVGPITDGQSRARAQAGDREGAGDAAPIARRHESFHNVALYVSATGQLRPAQEAIMRQQFSSRRIASAAQDFVLSRSGVRHACPPDARDGAQATAASTSTARRKDQL